MAHSIPGSVGLVIDTPVGAVVHTGDYKLDPTPAGGRTTDLARLRRLTRKNGVVAMLGDSTNADRPGRTPTEQVVTAELDRLFTQAKNGRLIIATFASLLTRLQAILHLAHKHGRKVALTGRSLETTVALARELGELKVPAGVLVEIDARVPDHKLVIVATGSQGEPRSALNRMARGEHRQVQVKAGDTIIISGGTIPGNETDVGRMLNQLFEAGANVIYGKLATVHVSGHGSQDEMVEMIKTVRPRFLLPVHGEARHQHLHRQLAQTAGVAADNVSVLTNGAVWVTDGRRAWREASVPAGDVLVDGRRVGEVGAPMLRDRQQLSQEGFIVVMIPVDARNRLAGEPQLISRGFIPADAEALLQAARREVKRHAQQGRGSVAQEVVRDRLAEFFFRETASRPVIVPSLVRI